VVLYREPFMFEPETDKRTIFFGRSEQSQFEDWPKLYSYLYRRANDKRTESSLKRAINTVVSAVALVVVFPLCVVIGIAIKLTLKGPVLFREQRMGHHGKPFVFLKFRSMYVGHDPRVHKWQWPVPAYGEQLDWRPRYRLGRETECLHRPQIEMDWLRSAKGRRVTQQPFSVCSRSGRRLLRRQAARLLCAPMPWFFRSC